jgi:hypothetical protein
VILEELYGHKMHGRKILSSVHTADGTKSADVPKGFSGMLVCSQQPKPLSITARKGGSVRAGCASRALAQLSAGRKFALLPRDVRGQGAPWADDIQRRILRDVDKRCSVRLSLLNG